MLKHPQFFQSWVGQWWTEAAARKDIEPFDAYAWRSAAWPTLCVAVIGIIASLRVPMAYCRFGCGAGAILQYLRRHSLSERLKRADGFALACLGLGLILYLVF